MQIIVAELYTCNCRVIYLLPRNTRISKYPNHTKIANKTQITYLTTQIFKQITKEQTNESNTYQEISEEP